MNSYSILVKKLLGITFAQHSPATVWSKKTPLLPVPLAKARGVCPGFLMYGPNEAMTMHSFATLMKSLKRRDGFSVWIGFLT